jgi:hypothetical protein
VLNQMLVELQRIRKEVRQLGWLARLQHAFALACAPQGMQTFGDASAMSAFNPKADIRKREWHVR